eukprot:1117997-Heterocapsa_arctica.AAC.1
MGQATEPMPGNNPNASAFINWITNNGLMQCYAGTMHTAMGLLQSNTHTHTHTHTHTLCLTAAERLDDPSILTPARETLCKDRQCQPTLWQTASSQLPPPT